MGEELGSGSEGSLLTLLVRQAFSTRLAAPYAALVCAVGPVYACMYACMCVCMHVCVYVLLRTPLWYAPWALG